MRTRSFILIATLSILWSAMAIATEASSATAPTVTVGTRTDERPADRIVAAIDDANLRALIGDVLERNPDLAAARAKAKAATTVPEQARSLPDPMAGVTAFLMTPETRVGPQQLMLSLSQKFPWFGKLGLRERAAVLAAAAAEADVEAKRLSLVTETRSLWYELGFLDAWAKIVKLDRETLGHYEELARTRYATGSGLEQSIIKLQAEMTRDDRRLLEIGTHRASIVASINALRARPGEQAIPEVDAKWPSFVDAKPDVWRATALSSRPELARADAMIDRASALVDLAGKEKKPDVTLGLAYTLVGRRSDAAGEMNPPEGNGRDILGVTAGVNLPIWHRKIDAGIEQAVDEKNAAEEMRLSVVASIDGAIGDLGQRLELTRSEIELDDRVLTVQAEQSLSSAEAGYSAGAIGALDLLDAERTLLAVRTATARTRADYSIALAKLEGTIASPIANGDSSHE